MSSEWCIAALFSFIFTVRYTHGSEVFMSLEVTLAKDNSIETVPCVKAD